MKDLIKKGLKQVGLDVRRSGDEFPPDLTDDEIRIYKAVEPFTMTDINRCIALCQATKHIVENNIEGDFVECGVWRGGSMMVVAHTLKMLNETSRKLYLYDTFEGMSEPSEDDVQFDGQTADNLLKTNTKDATVWAYATKEDVIANLRTTGYPEENIILVEGKVEDTIPQTLPGDTCLLRLDTDWYESTKHELEYLYPKLVKQGVLIIDDYGHWQGAKKAVDEYFAEHHIKLFLQRLDYSGRLAIKI